MQLSRDGVREQIVQAWSAEEEEIDQDEVDQVVLLWSTPGEIVAVPKMRPIDARAIARGRDQYLRLGCQHCHGPDGIGASDMALFDAQGIPTRSRDLVHEPFKGGDAAESIYTRIRIGMPGSQHPACPTLTDAQVIDLVHYCQSLSQEPKRNLTNHERSMYRTSRAYVSTFGKTNTP